MVIIKIFLYYCPKWLTFVPINSIMYMKEKNYEKERFGRDDKGTCLS